MMFRAFVLYRVAMLYFILSAAPPLSTSLSHRDMRATQGLEDHLGVFEMLRELMGGKKKEDEEKRMRNGLRPLKRKE